MDPVTYNEAIEAYERYRTFTLSPYNGNTRLRFEEFLDCPVFSKLWSASLNFRDAEEVIPEAAAKKIRWLNGPHGYALYKAWKAQHENQ